jgi:hypothetical protein
MDKLVLLKISFENILPINNRDTEPIDLGLVDLIVIKELTLHTATSIAEYIESNENKIQNFNLYFLNDVEIKVHIIKNKISIADVKKCFTMKNYYSNTRLDLIDAIRINMIYDSYNNILNDLYEHNPDFLDTYGYLSDELNDLYAESDDVTYESFISQQRFKDIVNKIENLQGLKGIPILESEMKSLENNDKNVENMIQSYLRF